MGRKQKRIKQVDYYTREEIEVYESMAIAAFDNYITERAISFAINHNDGKIDNKELRFEVV